MRTIYKYPLGERTELKLPVGARVIHVGQQRGMATIWVEQHLGDNRVAIERLFVVYPTGAILTDDRASHCGSVLIGDHTHHVYEIRDAGRGQQRP